MKPNTTIPKAAATTALTATPAPIPVTPPEWLRVSEACHYSSLTKPKLYDLMNRGLIRSAALKEEGQIKGVRLVHFESLRQFIESRATGGVLQTNPKSGRGEEAVGMPSDAPPRPQEQAAIPLT